MASPARRLAFLLVVLCTAAFAAAQTGVARAQLPLVPPGYTVMPAGWNLISTATAAALTVPSANPFLYTLQPNDSEYELSGWGQLRTGFGYWALFNQNTALHLPPSQLDTYSVTAPVGGWVMVGNPSTSSSARITGSDQSFVYSPLTGFRADTLVPVGYGAFVYAQAGTQITIAVNDADRIPVDFAACCTIGPGAFGGKAHIEVLDDSPFALLFGVRQLRADGTFAAAVAGAFSYGQVSGCPACAEYTATPTGCRSGASARTIDVNPGTYLIRLTTDGPRVPDIILVVPLQADTHYYFCRWVAAGRR